MTAPFASLRLSSWKMIPVSAALFIAAFSNPIDSYAAPAAAPIVRQVNSSASSTVTDSDNQLTYLKDRFNIQLSSTPTKREYIVALATVLNLNSSSTASADKNTAFRGLNSNDPLYAQAAALYAEGILDNTDVKPSVPLSQNDAIRIAVKAAGLTELAATYSEDKAQAVLTKSGIRTLTGTAETRLAASQDLAVAVETGLLPQSELSSFQPEEQADASFTAEVLSRVLAFHGEYKNTVGQVQDDDIFAKIHQAYDTQILVQSPELQALFDAGLQQNLFTGYNIKDSRYDAHFDPKLSLTYGHSDLKHAIQLIGLLRSEGIQAKVQLEPKTSAFVYLKEWGQPVQTENYRVVQINNDNYIAYSKEYDLALEFATIGQKNRFDTIINQYAKKNSKDPAGLIAQSWWQPLYYSLSSPGSAYTEIANNRVSAGRYYAQSFSLTDKASSITDGLRKIKPGVEVESYHFWVDTPFYRYLNGEAQ
ncbi:hypothetical protein ASL14_06905 [Paenibacillus sp. IHB B 3084]|uniref:hypothetical protein n=1 Tax=Paenibacillus sp. IHB B 3084 TaxID=867076 RepID=UPI0007229337|nr:hypothetical protein [Paenibacillus sp. IHB B 3084]ALP35938.1 hypothetical protein ASL14_06905 [Paenibacillus sp. IHB B 3084]